MDHSASAQRSISAALLYLPDRGAGSLLPAAACRFRAAVQEVERAGRDPFSSLGEPEASQRRIRQAIALADGGFDADHSGAVA